MENLDIKLEGIEIIEQNDDEIVVKNTACYGNEGGVSYKAVHADSTL